jgi:hypothetical protein
VEAQRDRVTVGDEHDAEARPPNAGDRHVAGRHPDVGHAERDRVGDREVAVRDHAGGARASTVEPERQQKIRLISWKWPLPTLIVARAEVVVDVATRER